MRLGRHYWPLLAVALAAAAACARADDPVRLTAAATTMKATPADASHTPAATNATGKAHTGSVITTGGGSSAGSTTSAGTTLSASTSKSSTGAASTNGSSSGAPTETTKSTKMPTKKVPTNPPPPPPPTTVNKCLQCEWSADSSCVQTAPAGNVLQCKGPEEPDYCTAAWLEVSGTKEYFADCGRGPLALKLIEAGVTEALIHEETQSCPMGINETIKLHTIDDDSKTVAIVKCCEPLVYRGDKPQPSDCHVNAVLDAKTDSGAAATGAGGLRVAMAAAGAALLALYSM